MAKLKIKDDQGHEHILELANGVTLAGRASTNTIQINDEKSSRQHFKIERTDDGFVVADLESTNGTRLNGNKIAAPARLSSGDVISVGKTTLTFDEAGASDAELAAAKAEPVQEVAAEVAERATMMSTASAVKRDAIKEMAPPAAPATGPKYVLKVLEGATPGKVYELGTDPLTLGRHASNTIQIDDEAASNYHAEVTREPVGYVLADLGSTNGTRVRIKDKTEFEKVVKAPLKPGMQIRVGKTLIEFENIGTPAEDDDPLFGVGSIDQKQLNAQLAATPASGGSGWALKIAALVVIAALVGLGVWVVPKYLKPHGPVAQTTDVAPKVFANLIPNANFDGPVDDENMPEGFKVVKGWTQAVARVANDSGNKILQISKGDAKALNRPTIVETTDPIKIDPANIYDFSARLRDDGEDGILGLHLTWVAGERTLSENPVVVKAANAPEWKEVKVTTPLSPPAWATHVKVGVFVQGKSGKAAFDDLNFKQKAGTPQHAATVKNGGIDLQFEGQKGAFSISEQGKAIVEECTLRLVSDEAKAVSDLSSALKPTKSENSFEGKLFDFAQQEFVDYSIAATPGAAGVDLRASFSNLSSEGSKPMLRFYLIGPAAQGEIEIVKAEGAPERLQPTDKKDDKGIKSVLFNAGKAPQFSLVFAKPVAINLSPEGKRRLVEIRFDTELSVAMTPEDAEKKKAMLAAIGDLQKAAQAKEWGKVEAAAKDLVDKFGGSFTQAKDEAAKTTETLEAAWKDALEEHKRIMGQLEKMSKDKLQPELIDAATQSHKNAAAAWKDTSKDASLQEWAKELEGWQKLLTNYQYEQQAEGYYKQAEEAFANKLYNVSVAYCKKVTEDEKLSTTTVNEKAKALQDKAQKAQGIDDQLRTITDRLRAATKNLETLKKYTEAIQLIERDPEYMKYKAELKELNAYIEVLKKKAVGP